MNDDDACPLGSFGDKIECSTEIMGGEFQTFACPFYPTLLLRYDFPKEQDTAKITLPWVDDSEKSSLRFGFVVVPLCEKHVHGFTLHLYGQGKVQILQAFLILLSIHGTTRSISRGEVSRGPGPISPLQVQL
jgi:hypothetical protein